MSPDKKVEITLAGQVFKLRCPEGEQERLEDAAKLVEEKIAELRGGSGLVDSLRLSLMAAFHLAYEAISRDEKEFRNSAEYRKIQKRLKSLIKEIDTQIGE